jgi:hypothetical protein
MRSGPFGLEQGQERPKNQLNDQEIEYICVGHNQRIPV